MRLSVTRQIFSRAGGSPRLRRMAEHDLEDATRTVGTAFGIDVGVPQVRERMRQRLAHLLVTDPDGSFVAEQGAAIVGVAQAYLREGLWCLSMLAVDPRDQSSGVGRALFNQALAYGDSDQPGLIVGSNDSRALRLYAEAGFSLRPAMEAHGMIDRRALPRPIGAILTGTAGDLEAVAGISRAVRGAAHTPEIEFALRRGAQLLLIPDRGFALAEPGAGVWLLAARDERAAAALLWSGLRLAGDVERPVRWITGEQDWAIDVVVRAGFRLTTYGALCVRGNPGTLRPFLPSAPFA